jgi:heme/copper-type cytochrome/quinol oxidase subunit 2
MIKRMKKRLDLLLLILLAAVFLGLPVGIVAYDREVWQEKIPSGAKVFTLTGNAERGWLEGDLHAFEVTPFWREKGPLEMPVIEVSKGDLVVFKLKSSDVVHGFSLKDFGVYLTEGIQPGRVTLVSFKADKVGEFLFSCNAICGKEHEKMKGKLIVKA